MKATRFVITWMLACILHTVIFSVTCTAYAADTSPVSNKGKKWRIGYYEGGPYFDYQTELKAIVKGLIKLGWVSAVKFPHLPDSETTIDLWRFLSSKIKSDYIEFVRNAYWSAEWDEDLRRKKRSEVFLRLNKLKDIDLVIAAGTWAGKDLANNMHAVPTIIISTTDPIKAKIIKSADDSGFDHVFARCDPNRYIRQLKMFFNIFNFKKLGTVFDNHEYGSIWAALGEAEELADEKGFELIKCAASDAEKDIDRVIAHTKICFDELAPNIDAFYFSDHRGMNPNFMPDILEPFFKHKIYTWSLLGSDAVKRGVLMSISRPNAEVTGDFQANVITRVLKGSRPRALNQVFEDPRRIAINLETAKIIGYKVPWSIMNVADEVYDSIFTR